MTDDTEKKEVTPPITVVVEGPMVFEGEDPEGDIFQLDGISYKHFLNFGYMSRSFQAAPRVTNLVGRPLRIKKKGDHLELLAEISAAWEVKMLTGEVEMGFGLAGVIEEREGRVCKRVTIGSVAILPLSELSDPRCVCKVVEPSS